MNPIQAVKDSNLQQQAFDVEGKVPYFSKAAAAREEKIFDLRKSPTNTAVHRRIRAVQACRGRYAWLLDGPNCL